MVVAVSLVPTKIHSQTANPVMAECEDSDGEIDDSQDVEFVDLFSVPGLTGDLASLIYAEHSAVVLADCESALNSAHLWRGPPLC